MKATPTAIPGVFELDFFNASDNRGVFVKPFHGPSLKMLGLQDQFEESFYSINHAGVIRGMHFQYPPHDHAKIVYCTNGALSDVILDLRIGSPTYGKHITIELTGSNYKGVYMPTGVAHGFAVHESNTCMIYLTSSPHAPQFDGGVHLHSFGYKWPSKQSIISQRDLEFPAFNELESPFIFS
jgi:dTDP-4-dehydrorhamnose 3,5-epimerase